jgi:hypothetical protein
MPIHETAPIENIEDVPAELRGVLITHVKAARHVADCEIKSLYRKLAAVRTVLVDRERELREVKGPCSNKLCCLHYAHSGPCDTDARPVAAGSFPAGTLERVRTEDDAYRVFEPNGIGTGAVTYDPVIGGAGHLDVTGTLSRDFDAEREAQIIWDLMKRGRDAEEGVRAIFERLEYLYRRLAPSTTRPSATPGGGDRG